MPFTSAWVIRSPTGSDRHSSEATSLTAPSPAKSPAISSSRSVLSRTAVEDHVLDALAQQLGHLVVDLERAGVDDPMSSPAAIAW